MLQIVRRQSALPSTLTNRTAHLSTPKERRLQVAFVSLAATNIFMLSSAVAFFVLAHKG